jgi:hypothetical protein
MPIQSANPPTIKSLEQWGGLDQQARRGSIGDDEEWWNENLFAIGPGNLRSCWGRGPAIYTAPAGTTILRIFFGFIGSTTPQFQSPPPGRLGWMFLSDGTIDQVDLDTQTVTPIRSTLPESTTGAGLPPPAVWEPLGPQYWASAKVWRPQYFGNVAGQVGGVLFGSPNGLYAWDGTNLSEPTMVAPDWLTDEAETTPEAPPIYMPTGLPGIYAMEVYQSRLWVAGKDVISYSAPSNGADFSTTDGGGSMGYFGDRLTYTFMDLAQSAGYLYVFGDSSTDVISNVQLTGQGTPEQPFETAFNYMNLDPMTGHRFPRPVGRMGRNFIQANGAGIFRTTGGDAQPIGNKISNTYMTLDTSLYLPTFATATMFNFRVLLFNGRFTDPWGVTRNLLLMHHPTSGNEFWSVASQGLELTNIGYYEQDSIMTPYGTDGTSLYQLFAAPDNTLIKRLSTKALRGNSGQDMLTIKNFKRLYMELHDNSGEGVSFTGTLTCGGGSVPGGSEDIAFDLAENITASSVPGANPFPAGKFDNIPCPVQGSGIWGEIDLQSTSPDFTIERLHIAAEERTLFGA